MSARNDESLQTHYRACNLCEAICGLTITHRNGEIVSIAGDPADPFSRGHICPKAVALKDIYDDKDRLRRPMKRVGTDWQEIDWEQALDEVADRLRQVRDTYGPNAIGVYAGNPTVHNSGSFLSMPGFVKALGTRTVFSASSVDQFPHHFAAWQLFGHPLLMPVPDIDHADFWLIMGGNPIASNGSIMTAPDVSTRLRAIQQRGGRVVVIDPRRTETAQRADEHQFIRPGTDVFMLLAMTQVLFAENLVNPGRLSGITDNLDALRDAVAGYTPERVAALTKIEPDTLRRLTREFAGTPRAALYGRVGVSTQEFGGLCLWLINMLNLLTGHLDEPGGMMFTSPAIDSLASRPGAARSVYNKFNRFQSRVSGKAEFMGELPVACLAEEAETPGDGQLRALVTSCGNPVLSTPNGRRLDKALSGLDVMVSVDIYMNETTRHADYILPPLTGVETANYDLTFHVLAIRNTARYSEPMVPKSAGTLYDWEIFENLRLRLSGIPRDEWKLQNPAKTIDMGLRFGPYANTGLSLDQLRENPHGIDLGPLQSQLPGRLQTPDNRINAAPAVFLADLERTRRVLDRHVPAGDDQLLLISRRHLRDNNSWMHNAHVLVKGRNRCTLMLHPDDAARLGIITGQTVRVRSRVGEVELPADVTPDIMPGVVCMPHGYGHNRPGTRMNTARQHAGASVNDLTDEAFADVLTGNAALSGVPVRVEGVMPVYS
ncbi:molybdopterin-dependent oxidoreductase [Fibrella forsythiae]|uniref:Molybdopterin-dependent oxidoreductase n=1 Tax=Fibrella forsythiae TaxID=2817061 RepID=A0ABS3JPG7_9BACT|nr:molybdopterin-dependent oxidoreductase [Fibrella forsythiae]MBO0951882.1 molybdopterin-dependent oxidoreductase [Fibrella forsythiae]